jgi:hypothetical protein
MMSPELLDRLSSVMQASRAIRSEVAVTICESSEMRLASRQLRLDSHRTAAVSAAWRRKLQSRKTEKFRGVAEAIAQILSRQGYSAFVATQPRDTALIQ